ncbi:arabinose ABC transporter permease [Acinetobacter seifertii]|uniref:arabinose ABC transporter permease n=1 Tax=Acinetobacter seifertii TaxID=1530123 RepID=UPI000C22B4FF|nr:arabinose ABC transporter permease [Acinetobacter seifertii]PJG66758.1 arabinose ABC transporter permease [Acinetobacter seifertii]QNY13532.1 arabinose ABC transporter permease [Acinetobacter seifertii]
MSRTFIKRFASAHPKFLTESISKFQRQESVEIQSLSTFIVEGESWPYQALVVFERPIQIKISNEPTEVQRPPINCR